MSSESPNWLVRSGGHILGPFSKEQIEDQLRRHEIVVFDEVCEACKRWNYIRDVVAFAKIVEELRVESIRGSDNLTQTKTINENTFSGTSTETITGLTDDLTEEISEFRNEITEIVYDDIEELKDQIPSQKKAKTTTGATSYGVASGREIQQKVSESTKGLWLVTIGVIIGVVAYVGVNHFVSKPLEKEKNADTQIENALKSLYVGDDRGALTHLKQAKQNQPDNDDINIYLGSLLIQVEGQTVQGKSYLEKVKDGKYRREALVGIGLAELYDENFNEAEKFFKMSLEVSPTYSTAQINLGNLELIKGEFDRAAVFLSDAIKSGTKDGLAHILYSEALIAKYFQTKNVAHLNESASVLHRFASSAIAYRQEAQLLLMYLASIGNKRKILEDMYLGFLDQDPFATEEFRHSVFVDRRRADWSNLLEKCRKIYEYDSGNKMAKAVYAFCLTKAGKGTQGKQEIDDLLLSSPRSSLFHAVNGFILSDMGLLEQSGIAIGRATDKSHRVSLPEILQGRYCEAMGDFECAKFSWEKVLTNDSGSVAALAGLARAYLSSGHDDAAKNFINRGVVRGASYKPLLEVKLEAIQKGILPSDVSESL